MVGSIPNKLAEGYQFAGGTGLGPEQLQYVPMNTSPPYQYEKSRYRDGYLYLLKEKDLLICLYTVVTFNPSTVSESGRPGSACYRIE